MDECNLQLTRPTYDRSKLLEIPAWLLALCSRISWQWRSKFCPKFTETAIHGVSKDSEQWITRRTERTSPVWSNPPISSVPRLPVPALIAITNQRSVSPHHYGFSWRKWRVPSAAASEFESELYRPRTARNICLVLRFWLSSNRTFFSLPPMTVSCTIPVIILQNYLQSHLKKGFRVLFWFGLVWFPTDF